MTFLAARQFIYLLLVAISVFAVISIYPSEQSYWVVWSGLTFALISLGKNVVQRIEAICVTGLACLLVVGVAQYASEAFITLLVFLFALTVLLTYLAARYSLYAYPLLIINLFAILSSYYSFNPNIYENAYAISFGIAIVLFYQFIFSYKFQSHAWQNKRLAAINSLKKLNHEIFSCLLQPEYADNEYIFERRMHTQKEKFMQTIVRMTVTQKKSLQIAVTKKLNTLYDVMLGYAQLRKRISDYTILEVCAAELRTIENEIDLLFTKVEQGISKNKYDFDTQALLAAIYQLENIYQQVIQVTIKEPLVFLLFIANLRALAEEMANFD